jgi:hypothetical protein
LKVVIADTSALQYLFQVGLVDLLQSLFGTVEVPDAVRDELEVGRTLGVDVPHPADYAWMSVRTASRSQLLDPFELGAGERAALSLALELGDSLVLLDDAAARGAAKTFGVATTGTLGILLLAKEQGLIPEVALVIAKLERRGFRITDAVRRRVLQLAGE